MKTSAQQFELPAMPQPSKLTFALREAKAEIDAFYADSSATGGLIPKSVAGRLANVSHTRIDQLVADGRLKEYQHFGKPWVSGDEIKAFIVSERKSGRPWKVPSGVGILKDMAQHTVEMCKEK
jgi:hypothetical protein